MSCETYLRSFLIFSISPGILAAKVSLSDWVDKLVWLTRCSGDVAVVVDSAYSSLGRVGADGSLSQGGGSGHRGAQGGGTDSHGGHYDGC